MTWDYYDIKKEKEEDEVVKALMDFSEQLHKASNLLEGLYRDPANKERLRIIGKEYPQFVKELPKAADFVRRAISNRLYEILPSIQPDPNE
tara:strand:- start:2391 stop:2663 length:273 start_codon:yes stop_codon:yes gene_type:complete